LRGGTARGRTVISAAPINTAFYIFSTLKSREAERQTEVLPGVIFTVVAFASEATLRH